MLLIIWVNFSYTETVCLHHIAFIWHTNCRPAGTAASFHIPRFIGVNDPDARWI